MFERSLLLPVEYDASDHLVYLANNAHGPK